MKGMLKAFIRWLGEEGRVGTVGLYLWLCLLTGTLFFWGALTVYVWRSLQKWAAQEETGEGRK